MAQHMSRKSALAALAIAVAALATAAAATSGAQEKLSSTGAPCAPTPIPKDQYNLVDWRWPKLRSTTRPTDIVLRS
jgi:hypothetical protein